MLGWSPLFRRCRCSVIVNLCDGASQTHLRESILFDAHERLKEVVRLRLIGV